MDPVQKTASEIADQIDSADLGKSFFESLVNSTANATFVLDRNHRVLLWNRACEELTGIPASAVIGTDDQWKAFYPSKRQTVADIIIDNDFSAMDGLYARYRRSSFVSGGLQAEGWYPNINGYDRYLVFDAAPVFDADGHVAFAIETLTDITAIKRLESALRESHDRMETRVEERTAELKEANMRLEKEASELKKTQEALQKNESFVKSVLSSIGEGFVVIDPSYNIISANKSYCESINQKEEDVIGRPCYSVSHQADRPCFEMGEDCPARHTFETGGSSCLVHVHRDRDGNPRYVEIKSYPIKNSEGAVTAVIESVVDVTERRRLEEQLRNAQKMEAVGQLAGGIAHDFNNILSAIMGYGNLLQVQLKDDDPRRGKADEIVSAAQKAAKLTQSLLAYSRKQVIDPRPEDLNKVIRSTGRLLQRIIGEDIALRIVPAEEELIAMIDQGQIEQVLMNLATNARDAMQDGGTLSISTERAEIDGSFVPGYEQAGPGMYALLTITDTGHGMDHETRGKIFDPFFTTKDVGKGTGLGLAMVYGIIHQHGGFINVLSDVDQGSTFQIFIPLTQVPAAGEMNVAEPAVRGGSETVLIVEDDATLRQLTRKMLEKAGYRVVTADDGAGAVAIYSQQKDEIDLVLMDVVMPKKNGKTAYEEIRNIRPDVKVLFCSGYPEELVRKQGILEEGLNYIAKPVPMNGLLLKVREVLDSK